MLRNIVDDHLKGVHKKSSVCSPSPSAPQVEVCLSQNALLVLGKDTLSVYQFLERPVCVLHFYAAT